MRAPFRMTTTTRLVLDALLRADEPVWGLRIAEAAGLGSGTVYPILYRLTSHQWVTASVETTPHPGRPPRHYYALTPSGRLQAQAVLDTRPR